MKTSGGCEAVLVLAFTACVQHAPPPGGPLTPATATAGRPSPSSTPAGTPAPVEDGPPDAERVQGEGESWADGERAGADAARNRCLADLHRVCAASGAHPGDIRHSGAPACELDEGKVHCRARCAATCTVLVDFSDVSVGDFPPYYGRGAPDDAPRVEGASP